MALTKCYYRLMITIIIRVYAFVPSESGQWDLGPQRPPPPAYQQNEISESTEPRTRLEWGEQGPGGHPDDLSGHQPFVSFSMASQCNQTKCNNKL